MTCQNLQNKLLNITVYFYVLKRISSSILHFSSLIIFIRSVIFFILIFVENPVKTLLVVEIQSFIIYILFINSNELSVLVLFSRSRDFIPGITLKDVLRFEERNKNAFF
jgi:energy-converting hydrogenase Eha subunit E